MTMIMIMIVIMIMIMIEDDKGLHKLVTIELSWSSKLIRVLNILNPVPKT